MTIPKVSQEVREYVARFGRTQEWLEEDVTAVLDGKRDLSNLVQSFAQFEQLIRSKVIDEAAGVLRMLIATDEEAAPNGIMDCIDNDGHPYQSAAMAGIITHARLIAEPYDHASSIRQLGERES